MNASFSTMGHRTDGDAAVERFRDKILPSALVTEAGVGGELMPAGGHPHHDLGDTVEVLGYLQCGLRIPAGGELIKLIVGYE